MKDGKRFPIFPILLITGGVLILIAVAVSIIILRLPDNRAPLVDSGADIPNPEMTRVSLMEAKDAYETGAAVFVDVREKSIYDRGHIPGAKSIPLSEIEQRKGELDPNGWILLYCT